MDFVLGFVFLLFLMLLVMIFGDSLSVFGSFHGRWFSSLTNLIADTMDFVSEAIYRAWCFVLDHLWWVMAVGSGTVGVILVGWLMFGGVADQAAADFAITTGRLNAGGVLDTKKALVTTADSIQPAVYLSDETADQRIYQVSSIGRYITDPSPLPAPTRPDRPGFLDRYRYRMRSRDEIPSWEESPRRTTDVVLEADVGITTETRGELINSIAMQDSIERAMDDLLEVDTLWRKYDRYALPHRDERRDFNFDPDDQVLSATADEVAEVEQSVRLVPGSEVADSDLRIEKRSPDAPAGEPFNVEIDITNTSESPMSGLIVREYLPLNFRPLFVSHQGVYRDSTVTWVVNDLRPQERETLKLEIRSRRTELFHSQTEISAVAAVRTRTEVTDERRRSGDTLPRRETERGRYSDVQMEMDPPTDMVKIRTNLEIPIRLKNFGGGRATGVVIRVVLPVELDHKELISEDTDRSVSVRISSLEPGEARIIPLRIRAMERGEHLATAELLENKRLLTIKPFTIVARDPDEVRDDGRTGRP